VLPVGAMIRPTHFSFLVAALAAACSSSSTAGFPPVDVADGASDPTADAPSDSPAAARDGAADVATTPSDAVAEAPTAPKCGTNVGDILCDVDLTGYERNVTSGLATVAPFAPFKLSDSIAKGTQHYALIYLGAVW
jgi:hypothetical protein